MVILRLKELVDAGAERVKLDHRFRRAVEIGAARRLQRGVFEVDEEHLRWLMRDFEPVFNLLDIKDERGRPVKIPDYSDIGTVLKSVINVSNRHKKLYHGVLDSVSSLLEDALKDSESYKSLVIDTPKKVKPKGDAIVLINFSDWHVGKKFDHKINKYEYSIFRERLEYILERIFYELDMYKGRLHSIHINAIGDMVDGQEIFASQPWEEEFHVGQQVHKTMMHLLDIITQIKKRYRVPVFFYGITGNHGLVSRTANPKANFDAIVYSQLALGLDEIGVEWKIYNDPQRFDYYTLPNDQVVVLAHGHFKRNQYSSAVSRVEKIGKELSNLIEGGADFVLMGHIHRAMLVNVYNTNIITTGSMVGWDLYSAQKLLPVCRPQQSMVVIDGGIVKHYILEIPMAVKCPR